MTPIAALALLLVQDENTAVQSDRTAEVQAAQVGPRESRVIGSDQAHPDPQPSVQLSAPADARVVERQVAVADAPAAEPMQLAPAGQTALAPPPLSRPAEGRTGVAERLHGSDRCDPQAKSAASVRCRHITENRAADFVRPRPELSPEQRLLVEQRLGEAPRSLSSATQRLANNTGDPASLESQAAAAAALSVGSAASNSAKPGKAEPTDPVDSATAAAIINALLGSGTTPTVTRPSP